MSHQILGSIFTRLPHLDFLAVFFVGRARLSFPFSLSSLAWSKLPEIEAILLHFCHLQQLIFVLETSQFPYRHWVIYFY